MRIGFLSASFAAIAIGCGVPAMAQAGMEDLRTYCKSDVERLCPGIQPGGGRIIKCLKTHKKEMTVGCAQALQGLKAKMH